MTYTRVLIAFSVWLVGCAEAGANGPEGAACIRLAQCAPGLACVEGMCSTDLGPLAEAGLVPVLDAGVMLDAGALPDVAVVDLDSGN